MPRETLDLSGVWKFLPDPRADAELTACRSGAPDTRRWREAWVPSTFEACLPELEGYEGIVWFCRDIAIPQRWDGRRITLRFEGVNHHSTVWVDGRHAGGNEDGFLPFELDVTGLVRPGSVSRILVRVDNLRREPDLPGSFSGWRNQGGILRDVSLTATDPTYLAGIRADADSRGQLTVLWEVRSTLDRPRRCKVALRVRDALGAVVGEAMAETAAVAPGAARSGAVSLRLENVAVWSPEHPALFVAELSLAADGAAVDVTRVRFGFRSVQVLEGRLLLNGDPLYLVGWNRHEDSPTRGMAQDLETSRADLAAMKDAGATFVRLCHYPHHPGELDLCDEIGLVAMGEIPLYGWAGAGKPEAKLAAAERQLERMILRDGNHPSLIFWSVSNETDERRPEVAEVNRALIRQARRLDPSRLAGHVSNQWQQVPRFEEDDVVCVNGYPAVAGPGSIRGFDDAGKAAEVWRRSLDDLHAACPGKPVLVTEFGYPAVVGAVGEGMPLDQQARVIEAEFGVIREKPYVCGAAIWCWADHLWPVGTFDSGMGVSPYGVLTRSRHALPAFTVARRMFTALRGREPPVPGTGTAMEGPAGFPVLMIRPHLRDLPRIELPPGYAMRALGPGDAGLWTDVLRDAEELFPIDDGLFLREFGEELSALAWRSFAALDERGLCAGVISAWHAGDLRGGDWGRVHWVAVRRSYQGRGIGRAMVSFALERLAQWHERALLETQSRRIRAIKLFLDFGFQPDLEEPGAPAAWREVARLLPHPALEPIRTLRS